MRFKLRWLVRVLQCFLTGHKEIVIFHNPLTGERDLSFLCIRCGRPKLVLWKFMM